MSVVKEMDTVYPAPLSCLNKNNLDHPQGYKRKVKKNMNRHTGRYRTTPVTFDEIKEVDEEGLDETNNDQNLTTSELDLKAQMDKLEFKIKNARDLQKEMDSLSSESVPSRTFTTLHTVLRQGAPSLQQRNAFAKSRGRPSI